MKAVENPTVEPLTLKKKKKNSSVSLLDSVKFQLKLNFSV